MRKLTCLFLTVFLAGLFSSASAQQTWKVDQAHSFVEFAVQHLGISLVKGNFREFSGELTYDGQDPTTMQLNGTIETKSVKTGHDRRDQHLQSQDFFSADKFPKMVFKSNSVSRTADGYALVGDLTLLQTTRPVTLKMEFTGPVVDDKNRLRRLGLRLTGVLKRSEFGMTYGLNGGIGDEVYLELNGHFVSQL